MEVNEKYPYTTNRLILGLHNFLSLSIGYLVLFLLVRVFELSLLSITQSGINRLFYYELNGFKFDFLYFINLSSIVFVPIVLLSIIIDFRVVNFLYATVGTIVILVYTTLVLYFSQTLNPLGADFLGYSKEEIQLIVGASGTLNWMNILALVVLTYLSYKIPLMFKKINWPYYVLIVYLLVAGGTWYLKEDIKPNINSFSKEISYNLSINKFSYFVNELNTNRLQKYEIVYDGFYFDDDLTGKSFKYIDPENYPFLNRDTTADVLANYFNPFETKPNIVIIIVESLGRSYSGPDAELGSFTPFLDSLASKGLYWENFLSNGGRTFAVLPSMLASLPFAEKGFLDLAEKMPKHQSLIRILKSNGYRTGFYHGGDSDFDNMRMFLVNQGIDTIVDQDNFPKGYVKMPSNNQKFTWGYGDLELFNLYHQIQSNKSQPFLDVFLTLSNHSPFKVYNQYKYQKMFEQRLNELNIIGEGREAYSSYQNMYNCVMYSDNAIRKFINDFKRKPEYNNTIFIITGDHRMPEIPIDERIDQFRVPLIIFSPKIARTARFKGVSSHLDITPSLISYLRINYDIKRPDEQSWLGSNLDTSRFFRSTKFIPMMRNKNELLDFVDRFVYISDKRALILKDKFKTSISNDLISQRISEGRILEFKTKNKKLLSTFNLIPDSVYYFTPR